VSGDGLRGFRLEGEPGAVAAFVERICVHCDVAGIREEPWEVWLEGALPNPVPEGVVVVGLEVPARAWTGLEDDAVIPVQPDLIVRPPWVEPPDGFAGIDLVVPRGGAFGSGESESTRAVLTLLHREWSAPRSFADVGTGSGILCLYAARRGVPAIVGCDVDPVAVDAARELVPSATFRCGDARVLRPADLVVANLRADEWAIARDVVVGLWQRRLVVGGLRPADEAQALAGLPRPVARARVGEFGAFAFDHPGGGTR